MIIINECDSYNKISSAINALYKLYRPQLGGEEFHSDVANILSQIKKLYKDNTITIRINASVRYLIFKINKTLSHEMQKDIIVYHYDENYNKYGDLYIFLPDSVTDKFNMLYKLGTN